MDRGIVGEAVYKVLANKYLVTVEEANGCGPFLGLLALIALLVVAGITNKGSDTPNDSQPSQPAPEQPSAPAAYWGAFAISPSTSKSTWATGYTSEAEANQAAINSCGENDCQILSTFGRGYAALAESDRKWYVSTGMASQSEADQDAMNKCNQEDSDANCRITYSINF